MAGKHTEQETGVMAEARGDEMLLLLLLSSGWQLHAIGSIRHGRRDAAACRRQHFRAGIRPRRFILLFVPILGLEGRVCRILQLA